MSAFGKQKANQYASLIHHAERHSLPRSMECALQQSDLISLRYAPNVQLGGDVSSTQTMFPSDPHTGNKCPASGWARGHDAKLHPSSISLDANELSGHLRTPFGQTVPEGSESSASPLVDGEDLEIGTSSVGRRCVDHPPHWLRRKPLRMTSASLVIKSSILKISVSSSNAFSP